MQTDLKEKTTAEINNKIIEYKKALELNPNDYSACFELGSLYYMNKNDPDKAATYYEKIVNLDSKNIRAKICLAVSYLKTKNYESGWKLFESRLDNKISENLNKDFTWDLNTIKNKTVFIYAERGFGDTIMFARFLPLLKEKCKKVLFLPQTPCYELLKNNNLGVEIINRISESFDFHAPIMSLPYKLGLKTEKDIPFKDKYLKADTSKTKFYKENYFNNDKIKIGINWQGNTTFEQNRKIELENFDKLFRLKNTKFYSLQTGEAKDQLKKYTNFKITDLGSTFNDFSDTAAAIENLDLVISNDTSVVHLAGALGKKCWVLLPFVQDWRWTNDLNYCPWYNRIKLFKQSSPKNWDNVFPELYLNLNNLI